MNIRASALSSTGRRSNNEDACIVDDQLGLYAVADGMGGYDGGELASGLALEEVRQFLRAMRDNPEQTWPFAGLATERTPAVFVTESELGHHVSVVVGEPTTVSDETLVDQAVRVAHRSVIEARTPATPRMGTTIVLLLRSEAGALTLAHVGDSRAYRLRDGQLEALTRDHSMVEELRAMGAIGPEETPDNLRNYITRALGVDGWKHATVKSIEPRPNDRYLLCSDGLSGVLDDGTLARHLAAATLDDATGALVQAAYDAGSTDNITVVVVAVD